MLMIEIIQFDIHGTLVIIGVNYFAWLSDDKPPRLLRNMCKTSQDAEVVGTALYCYSRRRHHQTVAFRTESVAQIGVDGPACAQESRPAKAMS